MENLMSLNPYVRQLRPRNESYIPPIDKVQNLFESDTSGATYTEMAICYEYNSYQK